MTDLVLAGDRVLIDGGFRPAAVFVDVGRIIRIGPPEEAPADAVRLEPDEVLLPGLVDTHVHVNEPGRTEWEGFRSATAAAAAGGVTTLIDMPLNSIPPTIDVPALEVKRAAAARSALVDVGFWGGAVPASLTRLRPLWEEGVFGFKCFLAPSGVDEFPHLRYEQLDAALDELAAFDGLLIVHAEDPGVLDRHANQGGRHYPAFVESRPEEAETTAIDAVLAGLRRTGGRAHILHLSAAAAVARIRDAKAEGLRITAETCPHYLVFDEAHIPDGATQYKCCPPIRDAANQDVLWEALLDGTIDLVVSDHSPSTAERKFAGAGDFQVAWGGIAGLQFGLPAVWTEARRRGVPLESVVGWFSRSTADFAGLATKGRIAEGADADMIVFAPDALHRIDAEELRSKNRVSAYIGHELAGVVRATYLAGEPVDLDGAARGRLLPRP